MPRHCGNHDTQSWRGWGKGDGSQRASLIQPITAVLRIRRALVMPIYTSSALRGWRRSWKAEGRTSNRKGPYGFGLRSQLFAHRCG
jgi:hypothetical protein